MKIFYLLVVFCFTCHACHSSKKMNAPSCCIEPIELRSNPEFVKEPVVKLNPDPSKNMKEDKNNLCIGCYKSFVRQLKFVRRSPFK